MSNNRFKNRWCRKDARSTLRFATDFSLPGRKTNFKGGNVRNENTGSFGTGFSSLSTSVIVYVPVRGNNTVVFDQERLRLGVAAYIALSTPCDDHEIVSSLYMTMVCNITASADDQIEKDSAEIGGFKTNFVSVDLGVNIWDLVCDEATAYAALPALYREVFNEDVRQGHMAAKEILCADTPSTVAMVMFCLAAFGMQKNIPQNEGYLTDSLTSAREAFRSQAMDLKSWDDERLDACIPLIDRGVLDQVQRGVGTHKKFLGNSAVQFLVYHSTSSKNVNLKQIASVCLNDRLSFSQLTAVKLIEEYVLNVCPLVAMTPMYTKPMQTLERAVTDIVGTTRALDAGTALAVAGVVGDDNAKHLSWTSLEKLAGVALLTAKLVNPRWSRIKTSNVTIPEDGEELEAMNSHAKFLMTLYLRKMTGGDPGDDDDGDAQDEEFDNAADAYDI